MNSLNLSENNKPVILICGNPHSMTSMVQKFLLDNGGYAGEIYEKDLAKINYKRYENKDIQNYLEAKKEFKSSDPKLIFEKLPLDKVICLKAPLGAYYLSELRDACVDRPFKVVYVIRNPRDVITSVIDKTSHKFNTFTYNFHRYSKIYDFCAQYNHELLPVMAERIAECFLPDLIRLLKYCELPTQNINISGIEKKRITKREFTFKKYRMVNFFLKRFARLMKI